MVGGDHVAVCTALMNDGIVTCMQFSSEVALECADEVLTRVKAEAGIVWGGRPADMKCWPRNSVLFASSFESATRVITLSCLVTLTTHSKTACLCVYS